VCLIVETPERACNLDTRSRSYCGVPPMLVNDEATKVSAMPLLGHTHRACAADAILQQLEDHSITDAQVVDRSPIAQICPMEVDLGTNRRANESAALTDEQPLTERSRAMSQLAIERRMFEESFVCTPIDARSGPVGAHPQEEGALLERWRAQRGTTRFTIQQWTNSRICRGSTREVTERVPFCAMVTSPIRPGTARGSPLCS
jgi:hypothetical protein